MGQRSPARPRRALAVLITVFALGIAACSASGGNDDAGPTTSGDKGVTTTGADKGSTTTGQDEETTTTDRGRVTTTTSRGSATTDPDADPSRSQYVDGFTSMLVDLELSTDESAPCIAEAWVDIISVADLERAGIDPDNLDDDTLFDDLKLDSNQADAIYDAYSDCGDDMYERFLESSALTAEEQACIKDHLDAATFKKEMVDVFQGGTGEAFLEPMSACA